MQRADAIETEAKQLRVVRAMKIQGSDIQLFSQRRAEVRHTQEESLRAWVGDKRPDFEGNQRAGTGLADQVTISPAARAAVSAEKSHEASDAPKGASVQDSLNMQIIARLYHELTGRTLRFVTEEDLQLEAEQAAELDALQQTADPARQRAGYGIEYDYHEQHYESEQTSFKAAGMVRTADGKEIAIAVELNMSREFMREQHVRIREGDAVVKDPLVINFAGTAAQLTQTKFSFDIDSDGNQDQISFVAPGSGFLALDKNNDGRINNGSELFGPQSGAGFAELAHYDQDGNQWIDAADAVYDRLRIWTKDGNGNDQLIGLGKAGVGAIYLGRIATPFELKDPANSLQGQIVQSGIYLKEDGRAGTVQQLDLVV
ncbi:MAG: VCBS repeat-containing protein [Pseudomonadota bacterium]